jgi:hypothetical protein
MRTNTKAWNCTLALFGILFMLTGGCKKEKPESVSAAFSVKIDGVTWEAGDLSGSYGSDTKNTLLFARNTNLNQEIQLAFGGDTNGTFTIKKNVVRPFCIFYNVAEGETYFTFSVPEPSGQIVITDFDKAHHTISGLFQFEAMSPDSTKKIFTDGKFIKMPYQSY